MFKKTRFTLLLLLMTVMLGACASGNTPNATPAANNASSASAATDTDTDNAEEKTSNDTANDADASANRTIDTVNGPVEIPDAPARIVADDYLGSLIALNVIPVGTPGLHLQNGYFSEALGGVSDIGSYGNPAVEQVLALTPDLIISGSTDPDLYEQYAKIAPTIIVPYGTLKNAHEELRYFGELLNRGEEAESWLAQYDTQIAEAKQRVDAAIPADATFSIFEVTEKTVYTYGDNFGRGGQPIYQALGRKPPANIADELMEKQWAELSYEILPAYAGDYLVLTSNTMRAEDFKSDPFWRTLPAIAEDRFYIWTEQRSWYYDPIAVLSQTLELADWLAPAGSAAR